MMLSDATIKAMLRDGDIGIDPAPPYSAIQPASVDLRLGGDFIRIGLFGGADKPFKLPDGEPLAIAPGECLLACTAETVRVPAHLVARVEGKSTWGRRFLMVHSTAGFIDPGFHGQITLELKNLNTARLLLPVGAPIAQISFQLLDLPAERPYGTIGLGSHYQGQTGATPAAVQ